MCDPTGSDGAHWGAFSVSPLRGRARARVGGNRAEAPQSAPTAPGPLPTVRETHDLATIDADAFLELIAVIQAEHGPLSLSGLREADGAEDWLIHLAGFHRAVAFLSRCQVRQSKGRWPSSYGLKHQAEALPPHTYVPNGALIAAAIALGLPWINGRLKYRHGQNAEVGVIVPKAMQSLEPRPFGPATPSPSKSWLSLPVGAAAACEKITLPSSGPEHS